MGECVAVGNDLSISDNLDVDIDSFALTSTKNTTHYIIQHIWNNKRNRKIKSKRKKWLRLLLLWAPFFFSFFFVFFLRYYCYLLDYILFSSYYLQLCSHIKINKQCLQIFQNCWFNISFVLIVCGIVDNIDSKNNFIRRNKSPSCLPT